ncbi:MAG: hypothetical protein JWQ43_323 [Glaciihabitans sp.]|nr:hypothetical protein [Glaciihabitans sp.]
MRSPTSGSNTGDPSRGSVTAEFAAVIPAVLLVLVACLGSLQVAGSQLRLQDAAAGVSRSLARGEAPAVASIRLHQLVPGAELTVHTRGDLLCVDATVWPSGGFGQLVHLQLSASSCAMTNGR